MNYFKSTKKLLVLAAVLSTTALFPIAANAFGCCGVSVNTKSVTNAISGGVSSDVNAVRGGVNSGVQGAPEKGKGLIVPGKGSLVPGKEGIFPRLIDVTKQ